MARSYSFRKERCDRVAGSSDVTNGRDVVRNFAQAAMSAPSTTFKDEGALAIAKINGRVRTRILRTSVQSHRGIRRVHKT